MSANSRYLAPKVPGGLLMNGPLEFTPGEEAILQQLGSLSYVTGDMIYWDGSQLNRLGIGSPGDVLTVVGGLPAWGSSGFAGSQEKSSTVPNGILTTFAFAHVPIMIFWNGAFQTLLDDYTVSGNNITFTVSAGVPQTGDKVVNVYA